jgi:hypothetical protein
MAFSENNSFPVQNLDFHGGDCEECCLLEQHAVWLLLERSHTQEPQVPRNVTYQKTVFFNPFPVQVFLSNPAVKQKPAAERKRKHTRLTHKEPQSSNLYAYNALPKLKKKSSRSVYHRKVG